MQKACRVQTSAEAFVTSRHLSATIYQGFHLSHATSIAELKYTYTDLYTENVNRAHEGVSLNSEVKCVLCK